MAAESSLPSESTAEPSCNSVRVPPGHPASDRRVRGDDDLLDGEHPHQDTDDGGDLVANQGADRGC